MHLENGNQILEIVNYKLILFFGLILSETQVLINLKDFSNIYNFPYFILLYFTLSKSLINHSYILSSLCIYLICFYAWKRKGLNYWAILTSSYTVISFIYDPYYQGLRDYYVQNYFSYYAHHTKFTHYFENNLFWKYYPLACTVT